MIIDGIEYVPVSDMVTDLEVLRRSLADMFYGDYHDYVDGDMDLECIVSDCIPGGGYPMNEFAVQLAKRIGENTKKIWDERQRGGELRNVVNLSDRKSGPAIDFWVGTKTKDPFVLISLRGDGEILVKGRPVERDKDVVDAMRDFLRSSGYDL